MAIAVCPSQEVTDLVRALGLDPKKVMALNLRIRPNELVTVTVRQIVESEPGQLAEAVGRFELVPRDRSADVKG